MDTSRIFDLAKEQGKSIAHLCRILGKSRSYLNDVRRGAVVMTESSLKMIADDLGTTPSYLNWETDDPKTESLDGILNNSVDVRRIAIRVPVLGRVPAGIPLEAIQEVIDYEEIPAEMGRGGAEYFGLLVKGDSMYPRYLEGDVIIVRKQSTCESGQDCVVYVNGYDATLKTVFLLDDGGIKLQPFNHLYPPKTYYPGDEPIAIAGVVVELRRKMMNAK